MDDTKSDGQAAPPADLGERGLRLWTRVLAEFPGNAPAELVLLEEAARTVDELERLRITLRGEDLSVVGSQGQPVPNGLLDQVRRHRELLARLFLALGITGEGDVR